VKKRKKERAWVPITAVLSLLIGSSAFAQKATRINFVKGATSAVVTGNLNGYKQTKWYRIRVREGQTLSTEQVGDRHNVTIYIFDSRGNSLGDSDASCNNRRRITETEPDDYNISVVECRKADAWRGTFRFRVTVR
jgi:hypothetical protein